MLLRQGLPQKHNWMCTRLKSEVLADIWVQFPAGATLPQHKTKMVLQYKKKIEKRWKKYPGKDKVKGAMSGYNFRLLNESKTKTLAQGNYSKVLKRFRQIEFFKHR